MKKRPFYDYGEGSVTHGGDGTCDCVPPIEWGHHPIIHRVEWPNRRAYLRNEMASKVMHWSFGHIRPRLKTGKPMSSWPRGEAWRKGDWEVYQPRYVALIMKISNRLFGKAHGEELYARTVRLPIHPTLSIYGDRTEESERWQERINARNKEST